MILTTRGRLAAGLALLLWALAFVFASAAAAACATALTLALAWAFATLPRPRVEVERKLARARLVEGETVVETLRIKVHARRSVLAEARERATPGMLAAEGAESFSVDLRGGAEHVREIRWNAATWGPKTLGPLEIAVTDGLRLLKADLPETGRLDVLVLPRATKVGKFQPTRAAPEPALGAHQVSRPGDSAEFFALRDYQPGDSIRRINWKASARSGDVIVNQVTRDTFSRVVVLVDLREKEATEPDVDSARARSGRAAASLLAHHDRAKDHVELVAVAARARRLSMAANPRADDLVLELAKQAPEGEMPLDDAIRQNMRLFRSKTKVYLATSATLDERIPEAVRLLRSLGCDLRVVSPAQPHLDDPIMKRSRATALDDLRRSGVSVVDWAPGVPLEVAFLET
ncbi:MAG: hypothetical protein QOE90_1672 [Thermoplasmata archaeon]|jgi:uncharacterized protein (DUF58 family)|nr:hypothetical protein [Thermoplasmata archaeon]